MPTIKELAEDVFNKNELVRALMTCNTPNDYEERKKAFVKLSEARHNLLEAQYKLNLAIMGIAPVEGNT